MVYKPKGELTMAKSKGQLDYEADRANRPHYHDGQPRPTWEQLSEVARWSWHRSLYTPEPERNQTSDCGGSITAIHYGRGV